MSGQKTWNERGSGSVEILNAEDRRQITCVLSVTASGHLLPMQIVYKGSTEKSLPQENVTSFLRNEGHDLITNPKNHWSSEETMKEFVTNILEPYYLKIKKDMSLSLGSKLIWVIDCWSVHCSKSFRDWLTKENGDWLVYLFVPACCTSVCQPCDVSLNRPFKAAFRLAFQKWAVEVAEEKFRKKDQSPIKMGAAKMKMKSAECLLLTCITMIHPFMYLIPMYQLLLFVQMAP
jgi:hypothetical protein